MFADLHLHTNFSDGTYTPEELTREAKRHELAAVALTDHDSVEGCPRMAAACRAAAVEFIPGTELTAQVDDREVHILGYLIDPENQTLLEQLGKFQEARQERIREMAGKLNALGFPLRAETVFELANCRSPGRPHVARALVNEGFCGSLDEAFERFLKQGQPAWAPKFKISAAEASELIHQAGGVAVLAHPGLNRVDDAIPRMAGSGLDGIECFHTKHTPSTARRYQQMADSLKLLVTGGSDCHGLSKGKPLIGTVKVPYSCVERLKERALQQAADRGFKLAAGHPSNL